MHRVTLVTGGVRSGKSRYALESTVSYDRKAFVATAVPLDEEMRERIAKHETERGDAFLTVEEPIDIGRAVNSLPKDIDVAVIDCVTVWLGNLMHRYGPGRDTFSEIESFLEALRNPSCDLTVVTNEVGMGIVPENSMARRFRDMAGNLNRTMANAADEVVLLVSGIPMVIKSIGKRYAQDQDSNRVYHSGGQDPRTGNTGSP